MPDVLPFLKRADWYASAADHPDYQQTFSQCWHPAILASVKQRLSDNQNLQSYLRELRPSSPARHRAISEALNNFSLQVARFVVEDCYKGKLVYAGGDDVLAFVAVDDLLRAMTLLRVLYSGRTIPGWLVQPYYWQYRPIQWECENKSRSHGQLRGDQSLTLA